MSSITELLCVLTLCITFTWDLPTVVYAGWLLAALPVRLQELGCLIPKQCLLLPISPLYVCILLTHHMKNMNYFGIVSVCVWAYLLKDFRINIREIWESHVASNVSVSRTLSSVHCYIMVKFVISVLSIVTGSKEPILLYLWISNCSLEKTWINLYLISLFFTKAWSVLRFTKNWLWVLIFNEHIFT